MSGGNMKKMYLSRDDKKINGFCGGLGEYLDLDSTLIRLIFLLLGIATGVLPMLIFYIIAGIVVPVKPETP